MAQSHASVTLDSKSNSFSDEFNPWASGNHAAFASTENASETGITYASASGRFTVDVAGFYRLNGKAIMENLSGTFPALIKLRIKVNGAEVYSYTFGVHAVADPWPFPWGIARQLTAGSFVECTIEEIATDNCRTTEGTSFNIARVA